MQSFEKEGDMLVKKNQAALIRRFFWNLLDFKVNVHLM